MSPSCSGHPALSEPLFGVRQEGLRAQLQRHLVLPPLGWRLLLPPPPPPPPAERVPGHQTLRHVSSAATLDSGTEPPQKLHVDEKKVDISEDCLFFMVNIMNLKDAQRDVSCCSLTLRLRRGRRVFIWLH